MHLLKEVGYLFIQPSFFFFLSLRYYFNEMPPQVLSKSQLWRKMSIPIKPRRIVGADGNLNSWALFPHFLLHGFQPPPPPALPRSGEMGLQISGWGTSHQTMGRSKERLKQKGNEIYRLSIKILKDLRNSNESDVRKGRRCQRPRQEGLTRAINLNWEQKK